MICFDKKYIQGFIQPSKVGGFTLVETLVAISILLLVIIGPMTVAQKGIQNAYFANEQVTAIFLAQEAIEGIRESRDAVALRVYKNSIDPDGGGGESLEAKDWLTSNLKECTEGVGCSYDPESGEFEQCGQNHSCVLQYKDGQYAPVIDASGAVSSPFTRKVYIIDRSPGLDDGIMVEVVSEVTWGTKGSVRLQTWLYNHYERYQ